MTIDHIRPVASGAEPSRPSTMFAIEELGAELTEMAALEVELDKAEAHVRCLRQAVEFNSAVCNILARRLADDGDLLALLDEAIR